MSAERAGRATRTRDRTPQAGSPLRSWRAAAAAVAAESTTGRPELPPPRRPRRPRQRPSRSLWHCPRSPSRDPLGAAFVRRQGAPGSLRGHRARQRRAGVVHLDVQAHRSDRGPPPLALVEASDGIGYILKPGDTLGDGRVTEITQSTVTFAVAAKSGQAATTATLRLAQDYGPSTRTRRASMRFVRGFLVVMTLWGAGSGAAQAATLPALPASSETSRSSRRRRRRGDGRDLGPAEVRGDAARLARPSGDRHQRHVRLASLPLDGCRSRSRRFAAASSSPARPVWSWN